MDKELRIMNEKVQEKKEEILTLESLLSKKRVEIDDVKEDLNYYNGLVNSFRDQLAKTERGRYLLNVMNSFDFYEKGLRMKIQNCQRVISHWTVPGSVEKARNEIVEADMALERLMNDYYDCLPMYDDPMYDDFFYYTRLLQKQQSCHKNLHSLESECRIVKQQLKACRDEILSIEDSSRRIRVKERYEREKLAASKKKPEKQLHGDNLGSAIFVTGPLFVRNASY